jgi:hypothetical protein
MGDTFVGVDMAKAEFVVACRPEGTGWTATNDPEGIAATVARLRTLTPTLIVAEATGATRGRWSWRSRPRACRWWSRIYGRCVTESYRDYRRASYVSQATAACSQ